MGIAGRTLRPLHIIGPQVDAVSAEIEVRGRDHENNIVSGQSEELTVTCTHATQKLWISFNGTDWFYIGTNNASKTFTLSLRKFWLKGDGANTTYEAVAGIL